MGARIDAYRGFALYAGLHETRFGCPRCAVFGLDDEIVASGGEASVHFTLAGGMGGLAPWARAGVVHQVLRYSGEGIRVISNPALGLSGSVGVSASIGKWFELNPGIRFFSAPANFSFAEVPARSVQVTAFSIDLGGALRF